jgi:hypothetical protein
MRTIKLLVSGIMDENPENQTGQPPVDALAAQSAGALGSSARGTTTVAGMAVIRFAERPTG